jgi:hypothetical protein
MKTKYQFLFLLLIIGCLIIFINGCYVSARVNLQASQTDYPVSFSENLYNDKWELVSPSYYTVIDEFSFSFTKWSLTFPINTTSNEDISQQLDEIIKRNNGDGIVGLKITAEESPVNSLTLVTKIFSLLGLLGGTLALISDGSQDALILTTASLAIYLLSPAAANITVEGKVVKYPD